MPNENCRLTVDEIARVCHAANCGLQGAIGEVEGRPWEYAPVWQTRSCIQGVRWRLDNLDAPISEQHEQWMKEKIAAGWVYGPVRDETRKQHPCIMPFEQLPLAQRMKDRLFVAIVRALVPSLAECDLPKAA